MSKFLKKHDFSLRVERHFTESGHDAYELIHFRAADETEGEDTPALECPENWSDEAAAALAEEAACDSIPAKTKPVEENTTPSWLWRRLPATRERTRETKAGQIFDRVVGAAAYAGWKQGVFAFEASARAFYDEARYMLAQRFIAFAPRALAATGLEWAYGAETAKIPVPAAATAAPLPFAAADLTKSKLTSVALPNTAIDAILGGDKDSLNKWQKMLAAGPKRGSLTFAFTDIASEWNTLAAPAPRLVLDVLAFRREDGSVDLDRLHHAVDIAVTLLDLLGHQETLALDLCNIAPLLMSLALPYDSEEGRATAAALTAIVTAEAYIQSAKLAAMLGPSPGFTGNSQMALRALRNHRRASYGDRTDYEKISVLPVPLALEQGAALPLVAAARNGWDEALTEARQHGLRHSQVSGFFASPSLAFFLESATQGIEPLPLLTIARAASAGSYRREIHPAAAEALTRLGYNAFECRSIIASVAGAGTLEAAPAINHETLRTLGFGDEALARLENYLPYVNDLRLAFTPFVLGEEFCLETLKVPAGKIDDPHFDLPRYLGFSAEEVRAANLYCFGRGTIAGAQELRPEDAPVFADAGNISADARIRMAAAVQSFLSGGADLAVSLPAGATFEEGAETVLAAWRRGVKTVTVFYEPADGKYEKPKADLSATLRPEFTAREMARPALSASLLHAKNRGLLPARKSKPKAQAKLVGLKRPGNKPGAPAGGKRS